MHDVGNWCWAVVTVCVIARGDYWCAGASPTHPTHPHPHPTHPHSGYLGSNTKEWECNHHCPTAGMGRPRLIVLTLCKRGSSILRLYKALRQLGRNLRLYNCKGIIHGRLEK